MTRGASLQANVVRIVAACAAAHGVRGFDDLARFGLTPTARQRGMVKATGADFVDEWAPRFVQDKFGSATTHWNKLRERIERGVGNPCPLLLIGIPEGGGVSGGGLREGGACCPQNRADARPPGGVVSNIKMQSSLIGTSTAKPP